MYPGLERFNLNQFQLEAIDKAIKAPSLFLIQGPPGTGKTLTLAALASQLLQLRSPKDRKFKLLICAPSNTAVDNITERLISNGVGKVCRMYAASREKGDLHNPLLDGVALHRRIRAYSPRLKFLLDKRACERLSLGELYELRDLKEDLEQQELEAAKVICCTCIAAGDRRLEGLDFECVLIDEAAQAAEPECLLPWLHGAKKVILAGDHKQLGPVTSFPEAGETGYKRSLFERLISETGRHVLKLQYRMHPLISKFPSMHFYGDGLVTHRSVKERKMNWDFPWINESPILFNHVVGKEEIPPFGVSFLNREEGEVVRDMVEGLVKSGVKPQQIGVITSYTGQKIHLREKIERKKEWKDQIEVASIDEFQGREKDYIIISCVRSNNELGVGFLNDERRLNVALTRARRGMIICGNAYVLMKNQHWKELLKFYAHRRLIVQGKVGNLKAVEIDLS